jgi:hypothetical protein
LIVLLSYFYSFLQERACPALTWLTQCALQTSPQAITDIPLQVYITTFVFLSSAIALQPHVRKHGQLPRSVLTCSGYGTMEKFCEDTSMQCWYYWWQNNRKYNVTLASSGMMSIQDFMSIKVKVKLSLCLTKHHTTKTYCGVEV